MITDEKKRALQQFLSIPDEDMDQIEESRWNENAVEIYGNEYLILTDAEADCIIATMRIWIILNGIVQKRR